MPATLAQVSDERFARILASIPASRIAVIGDVMLDRYLHGEAERISPEAPVPVVTVDDEQVVAGGAANVATNIGAAGAQCRLLGVIGDDAAGSVLVDTLGALDIGTDTLMVVPGRPTTSKTRIVARGQQVVRIDREVTNALPDRIRDALLAAAHAAIADCDVLVIQDYDKGTIDAAMASDLIAAARGRQMPVLVDPKTRNIFAYSGATVIKPNRRELDAAFNRHFTGDDLDLEDARRRLGAEHLLLTLGADGMALVSAGEPVRHIDSIARDVFDVSGAGDTVAAWVAVAIAAKATIAEAAWLANGAASIEVGKRGTATVSAHELSAWVATG